MCDLRLQNCTVAENPDLTITELKTVRGELKGGKCADSSGFICEIFARGGLALVQSMLDIFNPILPGGGVKYIPLLFFLHHPKTAQGIKLKLFDFKDTL